MTVQARDLRGEWVEIGEEELSELRNRIAGQIFTPSSAEYDSARQVWNAMIDRRPALIVQCLSTEDVVHTVRFGKAHNLLLSVRGGGHNVAGRSLQDDVLMVDLSEVREVRVDARKREAVASPGATLADVDRATQQHGLALPTGVNSTTGIAGLTLGGGFGWTSRKFGTTVDNLLSAEVVTVDGERLVCDEERNPDLFWAIRGGGGNFAIVTSFRFRLHQLGSEVLCGPVVFDMAEAKSVLSSYRNLCKNAPEELTTWAALRHAPPFPFIDPSYHGKLVLLLIGLYNGPVSEGEAVVAKLKQQGNPLGEGIAPHPFCDFQQAFDPFGAPGARNYWKSHNFRDLEAGLIDVVLEYAERLPSIDSEIFLAQMGGATNRVSPEATAYPHRDIAFIMNVHARWEKAQEDRACIAWARDFYQAAAPFATGGVYVNFVSEGDDSVESAYGRNGARLAAVKAKYDPKNVLRTNLNVAPAQRPYGV